jgi:GTP-binding protein Era
LSEHISGFVSVLGRPNAGKSTLVNQLVGVKVAIVADKPQTTRTIIQGVLTTEEAQIVFLDTPGIHPAESAINRRMMQSIQEALDSRDLLIYVHDSTRPLTDADDEALALLKKASTPAILALNKIDRLKSKSAMAPLLEGFRQKHEFVEYLGISATTGEGCDVLLQSIVSRLPAGPSYFPDDYLTDSPERFIVAESIREKILRLTRDEVPHSVAVLVDQWEDKPHITSVAATIYVERHGQKTIIVGAKGAMLKRVGTEARLELEALLGRRFYLELFVKVQPGWRENPAFLRELDWRAVYGGQSAGQSMDTATILDTPTVEPEDNETR